MGCGEKKLSKNLTQTFTAHCNAMICQQVTLSGDAEWPKVADAVIKAQLSLLFCRATLHSFEYSMVRIFVNKLDRSSF
jgi:hypothetical protein